MAILTAQECLDRLLLAGWTVGIEVLTGTSGSRAWIVTGRKGDHAIRAEGPTREAAWSVAYQRADTLGTLGPAAGR